MERIAIVTVWYLYMKKDKQINKNQEIDILK